ncbi:MAG: VWA domain-containing protein [Hyphomicrobiales bacterium]|nr:VWA domain-containing protein [Hyphomicrobiales bacterium]
MVEFANLWIFLILPLPVVVFWLLPARGDRGTALIVPEGVGRGIVRQSNREGRLLGGRFVLPSLIWLLLITALSGPRQLVPVPALPTSGRDLVLALDLSGSMVRDDFSINSKTVTRLDAVKQVGAEFVRRRGGDRVGLVVFGSQAYFATPLTFDVERVAQTIEEAVIGISGRATNISDALGIALKRLSKSQAKSRVVILLSDGANNAGAANPRGVAKLAGDMGVRVHTIALGPKALSEAPDERGVVDVATLQAMSDISGGQMFRVRTSEDLVSVTGAIDRLEATASAGLAAEIFRDLWIFPAMFAGFGCLWLAWRDTL